MDLQGDFSFHSQPWLGRAIYSGSRLLGQPEPRLQGIEPAPFVPSHAVETDFTGPV